MHGLPGSVKAGRAFKSLYVWKRLASAREWVETAAGIEQPHWPRFRL